jgi:hypothetical protein
MKKISNATRADLAQVGLSAYLDAKGEDDNLRDDITDLITDLIHLARREGVKKAQELILGAVIIHLEAET